MTLSFQQAKRAYRENNFPLLAADPSGLRFLKLQSLARVEYLEHLLKENPLEAKAPSTPYLEESVSVPGKRREKKRLQAIYDSSITNEEIERAIRHIYTEQREERKAQEDRLVSELYNIRSFDWGGLHPHSLEKAIVDNYVKKIHSYSKLVAKIENEIHQTMRAYLLCSWYEYWTSVIIQDLFTDHPCVLPVLVAMKRIDFFVNDIPFALQVAYLPESYINARRTTTGLKPEISLLKREAKSLKIYFDPNLEEARLLEDLWIKLKDHPSGESHNFLNDLEAERQEILDRCIKSPDGLIRWFYENQDGRQFDTTNRLFLVLVDRENFFNSWTLKRAKPLLVETIHNYLNRSSDPPGTEILFNWRNDEYTATADVLFAIRNR
jgi:hypothetical protein